MENEGFLLETFAKIAKNFYLAYQMAFVNFYL